ncbi:MAG: hypothetical protein ABEJ88_05070 [Halobacterium sp.]
MRLADDERARVPFALVGVVLLVASATAAAALAGHDPAPGGTRSDRAVERATTGASVTLAGAARSAFDAAARAPVLAPDDTRYGRAIDPERAFRDALALRTYARFEQALRSRDASAGAVTASLSLPRVQTTGDAEKAIDSVVVERVNDSLARVTVTGVRVVVRRRGRVVASDRRNVTTTVHSSVLALHDRVARFQRLLDRDAFAGPGLDRRLTDLLARVVWLRGPLQYAGAPVANVLANRHVELAANRALLDLQRAAFGRADSAGEAAYRRAFARVGFTDVLAAVQEGAKRRAAAVLRSRGAPESTGHVGVPTAVEAGTPSGSREVPVGVNVTADRAFVEFVDGNGSRTFEGALRAAFTARVARAVSVRRVDTETTVAADVPGNWTRVGQRVRSSSVAVTGDPRPGDVSTDAAHSLATYGRRVVVTERVTRSYTDGNRTRTVAGTRRTTYRVSVATGYEMAPTAGPLPDRVESVLSAPAGPVSDALESRIAACATRVLIREPGGLEALARRAVTGTVRDRVAAVRPRVPEPIRERAYRAAARARDDARNVTASVSTRALASGQVPVEELQARVLSGHDAAARYPTVEARAVAAVRSTYLSRVAGRLADRRADGALAGVGEQLGERGVESPPSGRADSVAAGPVVAVDGAPGYLTLGEVGPRVAPGVDEPYHPLGARNVNWFTLPHGDAADAVLSAALSDPPESVRLGRAAQALAAADGALAERGNATLRARRNELRAAVERGVADAARAYRDVLAASNASFTPAERRAVTRFALGDWSSVSARAKAIANGSAARVVAREAARIGDLGRVERDRLATRLRAAAPDVADRGTVRVAPDLVRETASAARRVARTVAKESLKRAADVAAAKSMRKLGAADVGAVPAGLPLAPVPGFWYATFNAWTVSVEGSWARFAVRGRGGTPVGPGNGTVYVREDAPVGFDVNGDGRADRVGRNERVSFTVQSTVAVVVPSGPRGVGDVDGNADERSPGWDG